MVDKFVKGFFVVILVLIVVLVIMLGYEFAKANDGRECIGVEVITEDTIPTSEFIVIKEVVLIYEESLLFKEKETIGEKDIGDYIPQLDKRFKASKEEEVEKSITNNFLGKDVSEIRRLTKR